MICNVFLRCLATPWSVLAGAVWLANDLFGKRISPGWWSGKLSDFSSLFVFPFLVSALLLVTLDILLMTRFLFSNHAATRTGIDKIRDPLSPVHKNLTRIIYAVVLILTGLLFSVINLDQGLNDRFTFFFWGADAVRGVADPGDLIALLSLLSGAVLFLYQERKILKGPREYRGRTAGIIMIVLCSLAAVNTSREPDTIENDFLRATLFVLSGVDQRRLVLTAPEDNALFNTGDTATFAWNYLGYYGDSPAENNGYYHCDPNDNDSPQEAALYQSYRLQIATSELYDDIVISRDTIESSQAVTLDLPAGGYFWRTVAVLRLTGQCVGKERLLYATGSGRRLTVQ